MKFRDRVISSISVGGFVCSGKTTLANLLAEKLHWAHINSGQRIRELAGQAGLPIENFGSLDDTKLREVDAEIVREMNGKTDCVWEGRLAPWSSRDFPNFLKLFCKASLVVRAERYAKRQKIEISEVIELILKREAEEAEVFERLYGITDIVASSSIDITLDTATRTPINLVAEILSNLK